MSDKCLECRGTGLAHGLDFAPLYADEATRPIVHALVAAIGYINGQSINSAAVMTAALKVGLEALEKLRTSNQTNAHVLDAYKAHHAKFHADCNISGPPSLPPKRRTECA
jgi:hypothetical protein